MGCFKNLLIMGQRKAHKYFKGYEYLKEYALESKTLSPFIHCSLDISVLQGHQLPYQAVLRFSVTLAGCPTVQFSSESTCLGLVQTLQIRAQSKTVPSISDTNSKSQVVTLEDPTTALFRLHNLLKQLTERRKAVYLLDYQFIIIEDTAQEEPAGRGTWGKV